MRTPEINIKDCRNIADYAKKMGYGIGCFRLKDGSTVKVLADIDNHITEVFQVRRGKILDHKKFEGIRSIPLASLHICSFEKAAESVEELKSAWAQSAYKETEMLF